MSKIHKYLHGNFAIAVLLFGVLFFVASCNNLTHVDSLGLQNVNMKIDWSNSRLPLETTSGTLYIYPPSGGAPRIFTGVGQDGVQAELNGGTHNIAVHNDSFSQLQFKNHAKYSDFVFELAELSSGTVPLPDGAGQNEAPQLPLNYVQNLEEELMLISANSSVTVAGSQDMTLTLRPKDITRNIKFVINTTTTFNIKRITGALSGVATNMHVQTLLGNPANKSNIFLDFETQRLSSTQVQSNAEVGILGFVPNNNVENSNLLSLYIELDIKVVDFANNYTKDLTALLNQSFDKNLLVTINAVNPDPESGSSLEFDVTVEPWTQEDGGDLELEPITKR